MAQPAALLPDASSPNRLVYGPGSPLASIERECIKVAASDSSVLITGDTGTGKEVFARLVHNHSGRKGGPFVPVNCGAIPETLVESELFGYAKGAFTGAQTARKGRIAHAQGGTLFLDEIGELPPAMQVKLLRVLQERTYEPVGSVDSVTADFRLIAATNRDLAAEVEAGRFRRDLYYRLMVYPVQLPPLRERPADVQPLFDHFWRVRGETRPVEPEVVQCLASYGWPGNVRELQNLVERLSVCSDGPQIRVADLPSHLRRTSSPPPARGPLRLVSEGEATVAAAAAADPGAALTLPVDLPGLLRGLEKAYIEAALQQSNGCRKTAAELLGLQRTTLVEKLRRWGREASAQ